MFQAHAEWPAKRMLIAEWPVPTVELSSSADNPSTVGLHYTGAVCVAS